MHRGVHMRCREGQLLAPTCHGAGEFAKLLSQTATSHSNQTPITIFPSLLSLVPPLPEALLSISLQGQGPLFYSSHLLCPSLSGQFLWGACFAVPGPAGPQPCQTCLFWVLGALLLFAAQSKSGLPAQPGGHPTAQAAQNHPMGTQDCPGPQASGTRSSQARSYRRLLERGQGELNQCFVESQGPDWLLKLLIPLLSPPGMLELGWLLGHSGVCPAPSCSVSVHVPSHSESGWCFHFPETRDWHCWLANQGSCP